MTPFHLPDDWVHLGRIRQTDRETSSPGHKRRAQAPRTADTTCGVLAAPNGPPNEAPNGRRLLPPPIRRPTLILDLYSAFALRPNFLVLHLHESALLPGLEGSSSTAVSLSSPCRGRAWAGTRANGVQKGRKGSDLARCAASKGNSTWDGRLGAFWLRQRNRRFRLVVIYYPYTTRL